jgi:hypothetical protein
VEEGGEKGAGEGNGVLFVETVRLASRRLSVSFFFLWAPKIFSFVVLLSMFSPAQTSPMSSGPAYIFGSCSVVFFLCHPQTIVSFSQSFVASSVRILNRKTWSYRAVFF